LTACSPPSMSPACPGRTLEGSAAPQGPPSKWSSIPTAQLSPREQQGWDTAKPRPQPPLAWGHRLAPAGELAPGTCALRASSRRGCSNPARKEIYSPSPLRNARETRSLPAPTGQVPGACPSPCSSGGDPLWCRAGGQEGSRCRAEQ